MSDNNNNNNNPITHPAVSAVATMRMGTSAPLRQVHDHREQIAVMTTTTRVPHSSTTPAPKPSMTTTTIAPAAPHHPGAHLQADAVGRQQLQKFGPGSTMHQVKDVKINGWTVEAKNGPILDSEQIEDWTNRLQIFSLPEMVFGDTYLQFTHDRTGFTINFNAFDALDQARRSYHQKQQQQGAGGAQQPAGQQIQRHFDISAVKVGMAELWNKYKGNVKDIQERDDSIDWTFSTTYRGTISVAGSDDHSNNNSSSSSRSCKVEVTTTEGINYELLKRPEQIIFYDDIILYEDELHDNGSAELRVKVRVMPSCFFCLMRYWLRVDGVILRIIDTRVFHEFGKNFVLRENSYKEEEIQKVKEKYKITDASVFSDPNVFQQYLTEKDKFVEKITFF